MNIETTALRKEILEAFFRKVTQYLFEQGSSKDKVVEYLSPSELKMAIDLPVKPQGESMGDLFESIDHYLQFAVRTGNKQFFNQLYSGHNIPAFMGEVVAAATNTSMYTYEVAPVATLIENEMISKMCGIVGFSDGEGVFLTGGSNANLIAMFSARNRKLPPSITDGMVFQPRLSAFVSDQAHYSFETSANLLGIGSRSVYKVKSDKNGRMLPDDLDSKIRESATRGELPFFVACTAGTTVLGAFDPFEKISVIARKHGLWMHVDGAFGGSLILGQKGRPLFGGLEKADSFAWNPHKLMNIPLICSVILMREKGQLRSNITDLQDDYIFHETDTGDFDLGKKSVQCGRRVDAVKLWTAWKYFGDKGYAERMDNLLYLARYFEQRVIDEPRLERMAPRQSLTVCFRYLPVSIANLDHFNETLRETLRKEGKTLVNFGKIDGMFAFRWVVANPEVEKADIDRFFDLLMETASQLERLPIFEEGKFNT